jgi:hypothetical protein
VSDIGVSRNLTACGARFCGMVMAETGRRYAASFVVVLDPSNMS